MAKKSMRGGNGGDGGDGKVRCGVRRTPEACVKHPSCVWKNKGAVPGTGRCEQAAVERFLAICRTRRGKQDLLALFHELELPVPNARMPIAALCKAMEGHLRARVEAEGVQPVHRDLVRALQQAPPTSASAAATAPVRAAPGALDRIAAFRSVQAVLRAQGPADACGLQGMFQKRQQIGTPSVYGQAFRIVHGKLPVPIAVKVMKDTSGNRKEVLYYQRLGARVLQGASPHFPLITHSVECDSCPVALEHRQQVPTCLVVFSELADGDLRAWLERGPHAKAEVCSFVAQMLMACMALEAAGLVHHDLHWGNLLYHVEEGRRGTWLHYEHEGHHIYVRHEGALWVLWDFGMMEPARAGEGTLGVDVVRILHFPEWAKARGYRLKVPVGWGASLRRAAAASGSVFALLAAVGPGLDGGVRIDPPPAWVAQARLYNTTAFRSRP